MPLPAAGSYQAEVDGPAALPPRPESSKTIPSGWFTLERGVLPFTIVACAVSDRHRRGLSGTTSANMCCRAGASAAQAARDGLVRIACASLAGGGALVLLFVGAAFAALPPWHRSVLPPRTYPEVDTAGPKAQRIRVPSAPTSRMRRSQRLRRLLSRPRRLCPTRTTPPSRRTCTARASRRRCSRTSTWPSCAR